MGTPAGRKATDDDLLRVLQAEADRVERLAGAQLACRPGCRACCHGPFPITRLDVVRLRAGLADLRGRDAVRARRIVKRALGCVERLGEGFPGDPLRGRLRADENDLDRYLANHAETPCPVLDPETGRCELYAARPVACRTFGPPLDFGGRTSDPCGLCFVEASPAEIEACRMRPDPDGLEAELLAAAGVAPADEWETLIAFAIACEDGAS